MALQRYNRKYWFPSGAIAANVPARIFVYDNNVLAPIFSDSIGTPKPNPTATTGAGFLDFWAEEGKYWVHIDSETFLIDVGMSEEEADLSTGIASGGDVRPNVGNNDAIDITAVVGYVVDNTAVDSPEPVLVKVDQPAQTVVLDGAAQTRALTWILMTSTGVVVQQPFPPDPTQRRQMLELGVVLYDQATGAIVDAQGTGTVLNQPVGQFVDLLAVLGPINVSGNVVTPVAGTLSFNMSAGQVWSRGLNRYVGGVLTENPHIGDTPARAPSLFKKVMRFPESPLPPDTTLVDPTRFDNNGVLTVIGGGTGTSTIQRVYVVPNANASAQMAVQYGQTTFSSLSAAVAAIGTTNFTPNPISFFGVLVAYIVTTRVCTNLADVTTAAIVYPNSKFPLR